jgi:hypothetical protein
LADKRCQSTRTMTKRPHPDDSNVTSTAHRKPEQKIQLNRRLCREAEERLQSLHNIILFGSWPGRFRRSRSRSENNFSCPIKRVLEIDRLLCSGSLKLPVQSQWSWKGYLQREVAIIRFPDSSPVPVEAILSMCKSFQSKHVNFSSSSTFVQLCSGVNVDALDKLEHIGLKSLTTEIFSSIEMPVCEMAQKTFHVPDGWRARPLTKVGSTRYEWYLRMYHAQHQTPVHYDLSTTGYHLDENTKIVTVWIPLHQVSWNTGGLFMEFRGPSLPSTDEQMRGQPNHPVKDDSWPCALRWSPTLQPPQALAFGPFGC